MFIIQLIHVCSLISLQIGFALICTCIVLKINFKHPSHGDMPEWFRVLVLHWMAKLFRMTPQVRMAESQKKHFNKAKRKPSLFTAWIPRFSMSRLYSPRGSVAAGEVSQGSKRRQSLKSANKDECVEKVDECNNEPMSKDQGEKYIALTEITVQGNGSLLHADGSSFTQDNLETHVETKRSPETNETQEMNAVHALDVTDDPLPEERNQGTQELERSDNTENLAPGSFASAEPSCFGNERVCLACSHKSAVHSLVHQQDDLVKYVESLADMARDMEEDEIKKEEWKLAAAVLDEFFFWLYLLMLIVSNAVIFSMIPKYD